MIQVAADIGVIGLAVMGQNLVLNMTDKGYTVSIYNRTQARTEETLQRIDAEKRDQLIPSYSLSELVENLSNPRKILLMVKAGNPVDSVITQLRDLLDEGDIIIDGGNSNYKDTIRRQKDLEKENLYFVGMGISGGETGARYGPSMMPGGSDQAWDEIREIFQAVSAKVDNDPCCEWIGSNGAGHFVKTVHNGIEYGDMQLISEVYDILRRGFEVPVADISSIFKKWNEGDLDSYLIEITGKILSTKDEETGEPLVDLILDKAGQKGTGRWTVHSALDFGIPTLLISSAVFQRFLSAQKAEREKADKRYQQQIKSKKFIEEEISRLGNAMYCAKIISYSQGFELLTVASEEYNWNLDLGEIASIWRDGCIIRSSFLDDIKQAYDKDDDLTNILHSQYFSQEIIRTIDDLRHIVKQGNDMKISIPALSTALSYFDGYVSRTLPANIIQAQRDYFGAHGYQRTDKEGSFHTNWEDQSENQ